MVMPALPSEPDKPHNPEVFAVPSGEVMKRTLFIILAVLYGAAAWAGPAPWYRWRSAQGDHDVCAQFSPGDGWVAVQGPFQDSACRKPGVPH